MPPSRRLLAVLLLELEQQFKEDEARVTAELSRRRQKRRDVFLQVLAQATKDASKPDRRKVERAEGGWEGSTLNGYLKKGDEATYKLNFRMTKASVQYITTKLSESGHVVDSMCANKKLRVPAAFKVAACLYYMAHCKSDSKVAADVASIGKTTMEYYLDCFCLGVLTVLLPIFMPSTPPSPDVVQSWRQEFAARRGIPNVAMACDGSHCPFRGGPDYRNYKGWESILAVAFASPFHTFIGADIGAAGKSGDNTVLKDSWLMAQIQADPEAWLGKDGMVAADSGASDGGEYLLNPIPNATSARDLYFNFCHSSTRFPVEEIFGRWKNRFRFLLYESDLSHTRYNRLVYVSMILHNLCTIRKDDAVDFSTGADEEWLAFFAKYARDACPECKRRNALHCPHIALNRNAKTVSAPGTAAKREAIKQALWADLSARVDKDLILLEMQARAAAAQI